MAATMTEQTVTIYWCPTMICTPSARRMKLGHEPYCAYCYKSGAALPYRDKEWVVTTEPRDAGHALIQCAACETAI